MAHNCAGGGDTPDVATADPVDYLLVDGLHDYAAVASDFAAFETALAPAARVAFHDYADYLPGVVAFVDDLVATGDWEIETAVETRRFLRRTGQQPDTLMPANAMITA